MVQLRVVIGPPASFSSSPKVFDRRHLTAMHTYNKAFVLGEDFHTPSSCCGYRERGSAERLLLLCLDAYELHNIASCGSLSGERILRYQLEDVATLADYDCRTLTLSAFTWIFTEFNSCLGKIREPYHARTDVISHFSVCSPLLKSCIYASCDQGYCRHSTT